MQPKGTHRYLPCFFLNCHHEIQNAKLCFEISGLNIEKNYYINIKSILLYIHTCEHTHALEHLAFLNIFRNYETRPIISFLHNTQTRMPALQMPLFFARQYFKTSNIKYCCIQSCCFQGPTCIPKCTT